MRQVYKHKNTSTDKKIFLKKGNFPLHLFLQQYFNSNSKISLKIMNNLHNIFCNNFCTIFTNSFSNNIFINISTFTFARPSVSVSVTTCPPVNNRFKNDFSNIFVTISFLILAMSSAKNSVIYLQQLFHAF